MAQKTPQTKKKKTTAKKTGTKSTRTRAKSSRSRRPTKAELEKEVIVREEIVILAALAVSIFLLISNFGLGGAVGRVVADFMEGIFGQLSYIFPFLFFAGIAFFISNRGNTKAYTKLGAAVVLVILTCSFLELVNRAGGSIGAVIAGLMVPALGVVGSYVVIVILMLICLILITQRSFLKSMQRAGQTIQTKAKSGRERHKAQREEKKKEKAVKRQEHKVEGVSFDTTLERRNPEIQELVIKEDKKEKKKAAKAEKHKKAEAESVKTPEEAAEELIITREEPYGTEDVISSEAYEAVPDLSELPEEGITFMKEPAASKTASRQVAVPAAPVFQAEEQKNRAAEKALEAEARKNVTAEIEKSIAKPVPVYHAPPMSLLKHGTKGAGDSDAHLRETAAKLQQTLKTFGVNVTVTNVSCGPSVTRYEVQPEMGVKVSKIVGLADDLKLNLAAADIRIEAPIPGKAAVGIEVPNKGNSTVQLRDLLETEEFRTAKSKISFAVGKDISGRTVVSDIAKMPHLLVAGATGSGKSVCINTLIMSILFKASPQEVKLIMIDPKVVELSVYNGIPHLLIPVVTDPKKAAGALNWAVAEMMKRYQLFEQYKVRDMEGFNAKVESVQHIETNEEKPEKMPQIVIIVDELADLMMVAPGDVEESICRLAQLARAAGIHLVLATQRPSVNVITGLIKANMPSRIAFSVSSGVDSRTIIDMNGAEKLLGKGDMLFYPAGYQKPVRVQGAFVSDKEVQAVVDYLVKNNGNASYDEEVQTHMVNAASGASGSGPGGSGEERDVYFKDAGYFIIEKDKASIGMLQRVFKIGFNRAARIMDQLYEAGVVGEEEGTKPRKVLMSKEQFDQYIEEHV
ncbi:MULTISPECIES: DNA translocase FtsK [Oscillospiraceae]|uniref:FtsK/SpoIIIE family DNA translocase n=1 Tax=Oscillospiraceae TaxID=216572 RepID=UPI001106AD5A|nr:MULTISPECIES: DNA translocase FtsK [Oscillospiraceae]